MMNDTTKTAEAEGQVAEGQVAEFLSLMAREIDCYKRLLRLSTRQNRYMRSQDAMRLELNAGEWGRYLPVAEEARTMRLAAMNRLFDIYDVAHRESGPIPLLSHLPVEAGERLRDLRDQWNRTVEALTRQNALNGMLARFCLETINEEAEIFRGCVVGKDGGCYDGHGHVTPTDPTGPGFLAQQV